MYLLETKMILNKYEHIENYILIKEISSLTLYLRRINQIDVVPFHSFVNRKSQGEDGTEDNK